MNVIKNYNNATTFQGCSSSKFVLLVMLLLITCARGHLQKVDKTNDLFNFDQRNALRGSALGSGLVYFLYIGYSVSTDFLLSTVWF